jgi:hypothetical protein
MAGKRTLSLWCPAGAVLMLVAALVACGQTIETVTARSSQQLSLTVYNSNFALVRDTRAVELPQGTVRLEFTGVASQLQTASVQLVSLTAPGQWSVLQQRYEYDLESPGSLLRKYLGREVTIAQTRLENHSQVDVPIQATLLALNPSPVWEIGGKIVTGLGSEHYVFSMPQGGLFTEPTLVWVLENRHSGSETAEATYLANDINWTADYVMTLDAGDNRADLTGWATIRNESGASFPDASLQLVAGTVHRVSAPMPRPLFEMKAQAMAAPPMFSQQAFSAYHLYTLQGRTTLPNGESKQISLLNARGISFTKTYQVNGQAEYYRVPQLPAGISKDPVEVHISFKNSRANSAGIPLPAGVVRMYRSDSAGQLQFLGEDQINHTPAGETVNLLAGNAFDLTEERKQTNYRRLGATAAESAYEITLRNHGVAPVQVIVNEPFNGDWKIVSSNLTYEKTSAFSARFKVPVSAGGQAVLNYTVDVNWGTE